MYWILNPLLAPPALSVALLFQMRAGKGFQGWEASEEVVVGSPLSQDGRRLTDTGNQLLLQPSRWRWCRAAVVGKRKPSGSQLVFDIMC